MKKFFKSLALIAVAAFGFASCEDVPAPYDRPTVDGGSTEKIVVEPKGDGTLENPFNVAAILKFVKENAETAKGTKVVIEATVSKIKSLDVANYTRAQYYINDGENTDDFYVYNGLYLGGENFTANDQLKAGDKVVIEGNIDQYNGSWQIGQNSKILKLNGKEVEGGGQGESVEPKGDGTLENPFNVAAILKFVEENAETAKGTKVVIEASVSKIKSLDVAKYTRAQYYINDGENTDDFYVYNGLYLGGENFTANDQLKAGDKVVIEGNIDQYNGSWQIGQNSKILKLNGKEAEGGGQGESVEPKGSGTVEDPYNVAAAIAYISTLADGEKPEALVYTKGVVANVVKMGNSGSIQFNMKDANADNNLLVYYCDNLGKKPFTAATDLKAGDEVIVCGTVQNFKGNTPEYNSDSYLVSLNGKTEAEGGEQGGGEQGGGEQGGGEGGGQIGDGMSISDLPADITTNNYGSQKVADESTWLNWTWNGVQFSGARICKASAIEGTIQFQGNASDAAKMGFIFNKTAWPTNIKKITLVLKVKDASNAYDPAYTLYAGSEAHPTSGEISAKSNYTVAEGIRTYVEEFDLSNASPKYFSIVNNKAGVLYVEKIIVE